jgi:glycyl-tRNA synthetase
VPFGIAQIGKAFRNEITPGNFIFRTREFEQMEMQFFVEPGTDDEWFEYWKAQRMEWVRSLGIRPEKLRFDEHGPDALAHYAKKAFDIQYEFPFGWQEFEGVHNRTDFDLRRHQEYSGKKLEYVDPVDREQALPAVRHRDGHRRRPHRARRAGGCVPRGGGRGRAARRHAAAPAPRAAEGGRAAAREEGRHAGAGRALQRGAAAAGINSFYDDSGSIGKRYRRLDEAGTPFAVTVDGQSV